MHVLKEVFAQLEEEQTKVGRPSWKGEQEMKEEKLCCMPQGYASPGSRGYCGDSDKSPSPKVSGHLRLR